MCKNVKIKRVLVPVQFDKASKKLLRYSWHLANTLGAELLLLHTSQTQDLTFTQQSRNIHQLRSFGESILSQEQKPSAKQVPYECVVRPGFLRDCIATVVKENAVDMVLMETCVLHQEDGLNDPNNAAAIMELINCPVMVMPCTVTYKKLETLVFATDFTDQEDHVLQQIVGFAEQTESNLKLVQIYTKEEREQLSNYKAAMRTIEKKLNGKSVTLGLLEEEDMLEGVSDYAEKSAASMLILATQDSFLLKRLFSSNYIKTMAYHTRYPILTFRQQKKKPCSGCCTNCTSKQDAKQINQSSTTATITEIGIV